MGKSTKLVMRVSSRSSLSTCSMTDSPMWKLFGDFHTLLTRLGTSSMLMPVSNCC